MAETTNVPCPKCEKVLKVPQTALGKKVRCPGCKEVIRLNLGTASPAKKELSKKKNDSTSTANNEKSTDDISLQVKKTNSLVKQPVQKSENQLNLKSSESSEKEPAVATPSKSLPVVSQKEKKTVSPESQKLEKPPKANSEPTTASQSKPGSQKTTNFENKPQQIALPKIQSGAAIKSVDPMAISIDQGNGPKTKAKRSPKIRPRRSNPWPSVMMAGLAMTILVITVIGISFFDQSRNQDAEVTPEFSVPESIPAVAGIPFLFFLDRSAIEQLPKKDRDHWNLEIGTITEGGSDVTSQFQYDNELGQLKFSPKVSDSGKEFLAQFLLKRDGEVVEKSDRPIVVTQGNDGQKQLVALSKKLKEAGSDVEIFFQEDHAEVPAPFHDVSVDGKRFRFLVFPSSGDAARARRMDPPLNENVVLSDGFEDMMLDLHYTINAEVNSLIVLADQVDYSDTDGIQSVFGQVKSEATESETMSDQQPEELETAVN